MRRAQFVELSGVELRTMLPHSTLPEHQRREQGIEAVAPCSGAPLPTIDKERLR